MNVLPAPSWGRGWLEFWVQEFKQLEGKGLISLENRGWAGSPVLGESHFHISVPAVSLWPRWNCCSRAGLWISWDRGGKFVLDLEIPHRWESGKAWLAPITASKVFQRKICFLWEVQVSLWRVWDALGGITHWTDPTLLCWSRFSPGEGSALRSILLILIAVLQGKLP